MARHVGAKGSVERCVRQIRRRTADGAQGSKGDRALRQSRHRAGRSKSCNAGCLEIAACRRGEAMGRRHQGDRHKVELVGLWRTYTAVASSSIALEKLERAKGFEPSTPTLARSCSTPELHPHPFDI